MFPIYMNKIIITKIKSKLSQNPLIYVGNFLLKVGILFMHS